VAEMMKSSHDIAAYGNASKENPPEVIRFVKRWGLSRGFNTIIELRFITRSIEIEIHRGKKEIKIVIPANARCF
jgi:hypothetical protein